MLFKMLSNYRTTMVELRRGDWSSIPKEMRKMTTVTALTQLPLFVSSVWWYSIVGFYIYLTVFLCIIFLLTVIVLMLGPWGPLIGTVRVFEQDFALADAIGSLTYSFEALTCM
jgi:ABC-type siderophore export system fused ATPase/permease subunit